MADVGVRMVSAERRRECCGYARSGFRGIGVAPQIGSLQVDPLVSIALCTYNGARFLEQQVESLLTQTYANIEMLAADDCSTDDTLSILERYAARDPRIIVSVNERNLGFKRNFEQLAVRCRGVFIAPCDQDDVWSPEKLSTLVAAIGDHALAYCDSALIDEQGAATGYRMSQVVPMLSTDDPVVFAFGNCVSGHAMLFRRDLLERVLPVPEAFFHDWWTAAVAASAGGTVYVPESLVLYRQHGANVTDARFGEMLQEAGLVDTGAPHERASRPRGRKLKYLHETELRLASIAGLGGDRQDFNRRLHELWRAREGQWLSPSLGWLMTRHCERLLPLSGLTARKKARYCRQFFSGVRLKRLTDPEGYART